MLTLRWENLQKIAERCLAQKFAWRFYLLKIRFLYYSWSCHVELFSTELQSGDGSYILHSVLVQQIEVNFVLNLNLFISVHFDVFPFSPSSRPPSMELLWSLRLKTLTSLFRGMSSELVRIVITLVLPYVERWAFISIFAPEIIISLVTQTFMIDKI